MLSDWPGARYSCESALIANAERASARAELAAARRSLLRYRCEVVRRALAEAPRLLADARQALQRYREEAQNAGGRIEATASLQRSSSCCIADMR